MEILSYFDAVSDDIRNSITKPDNNQLGFKLLSLEQLEQEVHNIDLALIGVPEGRGALENAGCKNAPDAVRKEFYKLFDHHNARLVDLGNLKPGHSINDTYIALSTVINELMVRNIVPIIIGGGNDLAYAHFLAYEKLDIVVNLVSVDSEFNIGQGEEEINSRNYLSKILLRQPNYLFNFSNLGYQSYLVGIDEVNLLEKLNFDSMRLGKARTNLTHSEPIVRNADLVCFDMAAARKPDSPGSAYGSPNGFYGEEMCQLSRYAGMSDKVSSVGIYELNPELDESHQSSMLAAQMIWYFMDGYYSRKGDFPRCNKSEYYRYNVTIGHPQNSMVFYKSPKSGRWWMEIPYPTDERLKYDRHLLTPCTYEDYQMALENEIPDRWIHTYKKLL